MLSLKSGDAATAVEFLQRALDAGEHDASVLGGLAEAQFRSGDAAAAKATLSQALALAPKDITLLRLRRLIR